MAIDNLSDTLRDGQDYTGRLFLGTVVEDQDPTGTGRFKAQVPGLFEDGELPWVGRIRESLFGMGPGYGTYGTPHKGSSVIIELQDGDANYPRCIGFYPKASDVPEVFKNGRVWGYCDPSGTTLVVNPDSKTYQFTHASGTTYNIDSSGSLTADVKSHASITINGNTSLSVNGNLDASVSGNTTVSTTNATIDAAQTTVTGNLTVEGLLTALAGFAFSGGGSTTGTMTGNIVHTGGTLVSNNVTVSGHQHPDTGAPIPGT